LERTLFPVDGFIASLGYGTGDHPAGMALLSAVLLKLFERERSGVGGRVSTSLLAAGAWSNAVLLQARLCDAEFLERRPREEARNFMAVYYRCADDRIFKLAVVDHVQGWPRVCRALGREEWIDDPRYATVEARSGRMPELVRLCDEIIPRHDLEHWKRAFDAEDVPFSVVAEYDEVAEDPQMAATDVFVEVEDPEIGRVRTVSSPLRLDAHPKRPPSTAPRLGEHTRSVLAELGYDEAAIDGMIAAGSVGVRD
jgi:formyl-CoA transferase